ncbi:Hypothetical protein SMAX5B_019259 [Scophthalmus maximus]|uniref:Uncharacterized protein n=1 Tax=Scophthalmus maximus TaxID=52904 RepID=A0A2U9B311_SCOMX|nr:Hypothetical protein SMAX5B_019259 [Scophthalmus maximus]
MAEKRGKSVPARQMERGAGEEDEGRGPGRERSRQDAQRSVGVWQRHIDSRSSSV